MNVHKNMTQWLEFNILNRMSVSSTSTQQPWISLSTQADIFLGGNISYDDGTIAASCARLV